MSQHSDEKGKYVSEMNNCKFILENKMNQVFSRCFYDIQWQDELFQC